MTHYYSALRRLVFGLAMAAALGPGSTRAEDDWVSVNDPLPSNLALPASEPCTAWYVDWRVQQMFDSRTSYQFGTPPGYPDGNWAPLSKLVWSLDSTWTGLRVGIKQPTWDAHFEWLTPMVRGINGKMSDYDWGIAAPYDPNSLDSLSVSPERWIDGQKLELEEEVLWTDHFLGMPIEFWPLFGLRWQRLDMMCYDGLQVIDNVDPSNIGYRWSEDMCSFNQQFYMVYLGAQLRKTITRSSAPPITLALQADYGAVAGYNVDHHISGYEARGIHRYSMESTGGDVFHLALVADVPVNTHLALGIQADHSQIHATGTHHLQISGTVEDDESWDTGVVVMSRQTSITAYLRYTW